MHAVAERDRARLVAAKQDGRPVVPELLEVLVVLFRADLHVPEPGELREALAQPPVVVGLEVHADAPPLVGHLVGPEDLVAPVGASVFWNVTQDRCTMPGNASPWSSGISVA